MAWAVVTSAPKPAAPLLRCSVGRCQVVGVSLIVKNDCVNVSSNTRHFVADGLKHHLQRFRIRVELRYHGDSVCANRELPR